MLDLPPGTYQYALRLPGQPARNWTLTVAVGDAWGLLVGAKRRGAAAPDVLIPPSVALAARLNLSGSRGD
jgi:hypothetical protein